MSGHALKYFPRRFLISLRSFQNSISFKNEFVLFVVGDYITFNLRILFIFLLICWICVLISFLTICVFSRRKVAISIIIRIRIVEINIENRIIVGNILTQ